MKKICLILFVIICFLTACDDETKYVLDYSEIKNTEHMCNNFGGIKAYTFKYYVKDRNLIAIVNSVICNDNVVIKAYNK